MLVVIQRGFLNGGLQKHVPGPGAGAVFQFSLIHAGRQIGCMTSPCSLLQHHALAFKGGNWVFQVGRKSDKFVWEPEGVNG